MNFLIATNNEVAQNFVIFLLIFYCLPKNMTFFRNLNSHENACSSREENNTNQK